MTSHLSTLLVRSARLSVYTAPTPSAYVPLPQRLLTDLHDNPLAIGLYGLIARLYLIVQRPIPLSGPDIIRYDPTLSRGAVICALRRLVRGGWVIETAQPGMKTSYTPTWGRVNGAPLPWQMGTACLGRPRHVMRLCLDRRLLDICMGKLTPHATRSAPITSYLTAPAVGLADIGCYALTLAGIPRTTPALVQLGVVRNELALPLPTDEGLLASLSQLGLLLDESAMGRRVIALTVSGARRLGLRPFLPPASTSDCSQPLFFVPPSLIDTMIETMIESRAAHDHRSTASGCHETHSADRCDGITWESRDSRDHGIPPLPPRQSAASGGGCSAAMEKRTAREETRRQRRRTTRVEAALPDTEAALALRAINVLPAQVVALADLPLAAVTAAIRDGQARPYVRDLAAWVVTLLRAHRSHGWKVSPPPAPADSPEAWRAAFAPYLPDPVLDQDRPADGDTDERAESAGALASAGRAGDAAPAPDASPAQLWREVLATMQLQVPRQEFQTWLRDTALHTLADGIATVSVPSARVKAALEDRYLGALRDVVREQAGAAVQVRVVVRASAQTQPGALISSTTPPAERLGALASCASEDSERPEWISAEGWDNLPRLLRAALRGATRAGEQVQGATPHLHALLQLRYQPQLTALLADAEQAAHNGAPAAHSGRATRTV